MIEFTKCMLQNALDYLPGYIAFLGGGAMLARVAWWRVTRAARVTISTKGK